MRLILIPVQRMMRTCSFYRRKKFIPWRTMGWTPKTLGQVKHTYFHQLTAGARITRNVEAGDGALEAVLIPGTLPLFGFVDCTVNGNCATFQKLCSIPHILNCFELVLKYGIFQCASPKIVHGWYTVKDISPTKHQCFGVILHIYLNLSTALIKLLVSSKYLSP